MEEELALDRRVLRFPLLCAGVLAVSWQASCAVPKTLPLPVLPTLPADSILACLQRGPSGEADHILLVRRSLHVEVWRVRDGAAESCSLQVEVASALPDEIFLGLGARDCSHLPSGGGRAGLFWRGVAAWAGGGGFEAALSDPDSAPGPPPFLQLPGGDAEACMPLLLDERRLRSEVGIWRRG